MNSSPYNLNKKFADSANPDSMVAGPFATSITGSSSLSTSNQMPWWLYNELEPSIVI